MYRTLTTISGAVVSVQYTSSDGDVQWYACCILLRLVTEANRRHRKQQQQQKQQQQKKQRPSTNYETDEDCRLYARRVANLIGLVEPTLQEFIKSAPTDEEEGEQQRRSQQRWRKPQLAQAVLDAHAQLLVTRNGMHSSPVAK